MNNIGVIFIGDSFHFGVIRALVNSERIKKIVVLVKCYPEDGQRPSSAAEHYLNEHFGKEVGVEVYNLNCTNVLQGKIGDEGGTQCDSDVRLGIPYVEGIPSTIIGDKEAPPIFIVVDKEVSNPDLLLDEKNWRPIKYPKHNLVLFTPQ